MGDTAGGLVFLPGARKEERAGEAAAGPRDSSRGDGQRRTGERARQPREMELPGPVPEQHKPPESGGKGRGVPTGEEEGGKRTKQGGREWWRGRAEDSKERRTEQRKETAGENWTAELIQDARLSRGRKAAERIPGEKETRGRKTKTDVARKTERIGLPRFLPGF